MKIAIVHDYLLRLGGAERVFFSLKEIFPKADVYTLLYDKKKAGYKFTENEVQTSFLQKFPLATKLHRSLVALMPSAIEAMDLRNYDLVISSASSFAKGLILRPGTVHICYCHNTARFLWDYAERYDGGPAFLKKILLHYLRIWDKAAANRVDYFVANSRITALRIKKYYGRKSRIIYPPVHLPDFFEGGNSSNKNIKHKDYYLIVSQLTPYKRIDLAIDAFNKMGLPLVIIGDGRDRKRLEKKAGSNIEFLGWRSDETVAAYYKNAKVFIFPGEDDFGIAPVEAMGFGKPVLAYRKGGATETIIEGKTGEFFDDPAPEALADGIRRINKNYQTYVPSIIRKRAEDFSHLKFEREIKEFILWALEKEKNYKNQ